MKLTQWCHYFCWISCCFVLANNQSATRKEDRWLNEIFDIQLPKIEYIFRKEGVLDLPDYTHRVGLELLLFSKFVLFKFTNGKITNFNNVTRINDLVFMGEDITTLKFYFGVLVSKLEIQYDYTVDFMLFQMQGKFSASLRDLYTHIGIKSYTDPLKSSLKLTLDYLSIQEIRQTIIKFERTGFLQEFIDFTISFFYTYFKNVILSTIKQPIGSLMSHVLNRITFEDVMYMLTIDRFDV